MKLVRRVFGFLEDRTGIRAMMRSSFDEQLAGGSSWAYVFGNAIGVLFVVQAVTGVILALTYTPSVHDAWSSTFSIQHQVVNGWFVRGLHSYGGEAMLVVVAVWMLQVVLWGAYKKPREVQWWVVLGVLGMVMGLLISGFRLPWSQHAYWALAVEMNIAAAMPVVGGPTYELIAGGPALGQNTLTRLYVAHVLLLPGALGGLLWFRRQLRRRHGVGTLPWASRGRTETFFPSQTAKDLVFVALVLGAVCVMTMMSHGVDLGGPAEPDRDYPARPEWFLLPLYKLRMLLPPSMEMVATVVIPGVLTLFLVGLPFLDRRESKGWLSRLPWVAPLLLIGAGAGYLTNESMADDAADEDFQEAKAIVQARADRALELASWGIPPEGPVAMLNSDPMLRGAEVYAQYCSSCHVLNGEGEREAPDHTGFGSEEWLVRLLYDPRDDHFFGLAEMDDTMPSQKRLGEERIRAVAAFMFSLGREENDPELADAEAVAAGEAVFRDACLRCHTFQRQGDLMGTGGPELSLWGSRTWIYRQVHDPDTTYGGLNEMPAFSDQLTDHDIRMVTAYLRLQRFEEPDFDVERE